MRIYKNERQIKRNRQLATASFFVSLAILIGGLVVTNTMAKNDVILTLVPCIVLPIGLLTTWFSVRLTNQYIREPHPEDAIQIAAKGVGQESLLYHYLFKSNHVLVCQQGVFAIVTRFQNGPIIVKGKSMVDAKARGVFGRWMALMRQEQLGDPMTEAQTAADDLQTLIDEILPDSSIKVQPLVVMISPKVVIELEEPEIPVVMANPKKKPSLKSLLRDIRLKGSLLTPKQLSLLEEGLNSELSIQSTPLETKESKSSDDEDAS